MKSFPFLSLLVAVMLLGTAQMSVAQDQDASSDGPTPATELVDLSEFEGSFEGRDFRMQGEVLTYFREGMQQSIELNLKAPDHFEIVIPPGAQVQSADGHPIPTFRFERDEDGAIAKLIIVAPDGTTMAEHPKTESFESSDAPDIQ